MKRPPLFELEDGGEKRGQVGVTVEDPLPIVATKDREPTKLGRPGGNER